MTTVNEKAQDQTNIAVRYGPGSTPDSAQDIAGSLNTATAISISSRSTPLSSPRSVFSGSSPLINDVREHVWPETGRRLDRDDPNSDSEVAEEVVRSPTPPSASSNEASRPSSAATERSAFPSSSTTLPALEILEESSTWTRKRLRPKSGQAVAIRQEHPTEAQQVGSRTGREKRRKLSTCHRLSPVLDRTGRKPLEVLISQIGQNDMMVDIQESARKLETRSYNVRKPVRYLPSRTPIDIDTPAVRIIDAVPHLAREIEDSTLNEQLSRVHHRIALADFYCAYRAAHAQPHTFLKELDRHPSQHIHQAQPRNRNKHTEVKKRFIELVFGQSTSQDDRRKSSTYVNNWQKAGKPWFELIKRFGPGILLLMPEGVTNCRQVFHRKT